MIVLISGAKKNVGDFLITDRAHRLLSRFVDPDIVVLNRFDDLSSKIDIFNKSRAVILGGGPAYAPDVFPGIYPFINHYEDIKPPIIPMGLGWNGVHFEDPSKFQFSETSVDYLKKIHARIKYSSCRDVITLGILQRLGIDNALMTGCPVWYELDKIGIPYKSAPISKIVITVGASQSLVGQTLSLVHLVRSHFKMAEIILSFHRGILPGKNTPPRKGLAYSTIALLAKRYGVTIRDVSGNVENIEFYKNCDFHVGYRVHAHLLFLSNRIPSILINEDGRGVGMGKSLGLPILNFNQDSLIESVDQLISRYKEQDFSDFNDTFITIDTTFNVMKKFLSSID